MSFFTRAFTFFGSLCQIPSPARYRTDVTGLKKKKKKEAAHTLSQFPQRGCFESKMPVHTTQKERDFT